MDAWTIFIHGYNNSEKAAASIWQHTSNELLRQHLDLTAVVLFFWPGDYSRSEILSAMNYPRVVPIAEESARLLAEYLERATQTRLVPLRLSLVAHSLGSLVALETLRRLRSSRAKIAVGDVLMMAAAVPEGFCLSGENYGTPFSAETKETVLYSLQDGVLKKYFQLGQELANRFHEDRRDAVGRTGGPGAGPGERWSAAVHMHRFEHGDYWNKPESIERIARLIAPHQKSLMLLSGRADSHDKLEPMREDALPIDDLPQDGYVPPDVTLRLLVRPYGSS